MAKNKVYALIFPDGKSKIIEKPWEKVQLIVSGVSNIRFKGFPRRSEAEVWIREVKPKHLNKLDVQAILKKTKGKNITSGSQWKKNNINTSYWNKGPNKR